MSKRGGNIDDGAAAFRKRQKITHEVPAGEDVYSSDQLRQLLSFDQDLGRARHGLQSFKRLLDEIHASESDDNDKLQILYEYLEASKPRQTGEDAVFLNDIMEMWSFAAQVNNDGVMSSVAVVLALVLSTLSGSLKMVSHGLGICQTLIQERQLKSLSKNLSVEKGKAFIISPTLRLLREAVTLDGGAFAKRIFRARQSTFTALGRNLEIGHSGDGIEDAKKTSVRTNAVKFLLACLKYLHSDGRKELMTQRELISHLTYTIRNDPPYLILDILNTLQNYVLSDDNISREAKLRNFNTKTLWRILALYSYGTNAIPQEERAAVADKAHAFLVYVCTSPGAGVLYPSTGLYPRPLDDESSNTRKSKLVNLEGAIAEDRYSKDVPVYNYVLSEFTQKLRPWSSRKHSELLITIFNAAPELIADFFLSNRDFSFAPKLSMTWIGYAACLFDTMQIPIPDHFGDRSKYSAAPPPVSILLANIIPLPIDRKALIKCLEPGSNLTSFFATRILVLALEKLEKVLSMLQGATRTSDALWVESSKKLIDAFCQRIPDMKEIVRMYRSVPAENLLHKTLGSRLLRLYYEVVPRVALAANFDVSPLLVDILGKLDHEEATADAKAFAVMELENLVSIASHSPGMRWFNRPSGASTLPFIALLQVLCSDGQNTPSDQIRRVLNTIALESQIVSKKAGLRPLLQALRCAVNNDRVTDMSPVWPFLDNCISRCASTPIKYLELLETYEHDEQVSSEEVSLLNVTLAEQLRFITASSESKGKVALANFLILFFNAAAKSKENSILVHAIYKQVQGQLAEADLESRSLGGKADLEALKAHKVMDDSDSTTKTKPITNTSSIDASQLEEILHIAIPEEEDTSALTKWTTKNAEDLIEDAHATKLVLLLSSPHRSIRKEALTNVLKLSSRLKESSYEEKEQIWLLLSELAESSRPHVDAGPVPSAFTAFATHAVEVLRNPLHPLYPKVNTFLTRSPMWPADKLPLAHDILHGEPSEDDRYYTEITWLLTYLLDALRRASDLSVFHKKKWFEKILVLGANPYLRTNLRTRILRVVYRATCIEGGSTTLTTRFGIISWLVAQRAACESGSVE
ncbi:uncharacterized protein J7T54_007296 [Emericellopsis cladophorae]|uniref:Ribosome biogenesis protein Urb1 n=1 Tax=Emericellopsis cladophorae TaxID=2686198 RepID=A0A9P9XYZ3_9HYPO|nr:uncharacterized protein J7T54_007296 [Emericellopsis cladophorae]KAI6780447.1 hypothetical protein J7T54_007296 [Emericellopsis cladophorae]